MGKLVLLAEDDEEMARLLKYALRQEGYEVLSASNGMDLMENIDEFRHQVIHGRFFDVDLIVSDIRMPWLSGLEVLRELRQVDKVTPVILITAFGDEHTHAEAARLGAWVLDKPFEMEDFLDAVRANLQQARQKELQNDYTTDSFRTG